MKYPSRTVLAGWWFMLGILMFAASECHAARPYQPLFGDPLVEPWRWRMFPDLSGLDTLCMAEGQDGTMWFGTANHLWSYDGIEWSSHATNEMLGRYVTAICREPDGAICVGGEWGISQFNQGKWTPILSGSGNRFGDIRKMVVAKDGAVWVATSLGALRRADSLWTLYTDFATADRLRRGERFPLRIKVELLPETLVAKMRGSGLQSFNGCDFHEVSADARGRIWIGAAGGDVLCFTPAATNAEAQGEWSLHGGSEGLLPGTVTSILPARDGRIWVAHAASEEADVLDGGMWRRLRLPLALPALDLGDAGGKLLQTRDGVVWLAARYALHSFRDGKWRTYEQPETAVPSTRNVVIQTTDGALWLSGPDGEIHRVDYQTPRWMTLEDLNFQWESPGGARWFLERNGRVVIHDGEEWKSLGVEDGLIDTPVALLGTRRGEIWLAGSHEGSAATARFADQKWQRHVHENFSCGIDSRAIFESSDGSVWVGAFVDTDGPEEHRDGILQFRDGIWTHHHQPGRAPPAGGLAVPGPLLPASRDPDHPIEKFLCFGESRDGRIWAGRNVLAFYDGSKWDEFIAPDRTQIVESMLTTREGDLWIGSRQHGALLYEGPDWRYFKGKDSLVANSVRSLAQSLDGSIWAATDRGVSRYDGHSWMADVLPEEMTFPHEGGSLKVSASGDLWINRFTREWNQRFWGKMKPAPTNAVFRTFRHRFRAGTPETSIVVGPRTVSQPGNVSILWSGVVSWREPKDSRVQFSYRLNDQPWSPYTSDSGHSFFSLPSGRHHFQVRARDDDFNVDPTPAVLDFVVMPPVWAQGWFILLMTFTSGLILLQTTRVFLERGRLRRINRALSRQIEERRRVQEALRQSEARLSFALETNNIGAWDLNLEDHSTQRTATHDRIFGYATMLPQWTYEMFLEHIVPEDRGEVARRFAEVLKANGEWDCEFRIRRADGEIRWIWATGGYRSAANGKAPMFSGLVHDITERKKSEEEIRKLNESLEQRVLDRTAQLEVANRELEAFSYSVSHDLRTPLRSIDGFSRALLEDYGDKLDAEGRDYLQTVRAASQRMGQLIDDMLRLAQINRCEMGRADVNLSQIAGQVLCDLKKSEPDRQVEAVIAPDCIVSGDAALLRIVLENVIGNAWKYTGKKSVAKIEFGREQTGETGAFFVRDNGCGFDMKYAHRLFGAFQRLHDRHEFPGTGIGLASVQRIIHRHGGTVWIEGRVDEGTTLHFALPQRS